MRVTGLEPATSGVTGEGVEAIDDAVRAAVELDAPEQATTVEVLRAGWAPAVPFLHQSAFAA
jgi:hypothetical protein